MLIIYALNRDLNEEFWLGQFVKNKQILCQGELGMSVLDSELKLYLLTRTLNIIGWKLYVIVWVLWDHYHSFKMVQKVFGGFLKEDCLKGFTKFWVFKRQDVFKKTDKLSVLLNYASMILLYRLIFELCCVWWN